MSRARVSKTIVHVAGGQPQGGLVQQQQAGGDHQPAGDGQHLLLAPGHRPRQLRAALRQAGEEGQHALQGLALAGGVWRG